MTIGQWSHTMSQAFWPPSIFHSVDADGVHPDPERIETIRQMKNPNNATEL